jgi:ABC-type transport system involved in multi-copper enzyme maturation permease subunit
MRRARLLRYGRFQLEDYAIERAIMIIILAALNMGGPVMMIRESSSADRTLSPGSAVGSEILVVFSMLIVLAAVFSSQELISRARRNGYYRLIFSKPVSPVLFYAQLFAVHLIGACLVMLLLAAAFSQIAMPLPLQNIAGVTAIAFVLLGGLGFLFSSFIRFDSFAVIAAIGLSMLGKTLAQRYTGLGPKFANLLVPIDHLGNLRPLVIGGSAHAADVYWVLGYGLIAFILGLVAVHYRQLAD